MRDAATRADGTIRTMPAVLPPPASARRPAPERRTARDASRSSALAFPMRSWRSCRSLSFSPLGFRAPLHHRHYHVGQIVARRHVRHPTANMQCPRGCTRQQGDVRVHLHPRELGVEPRLPRLRLMLISRVLEVGLEEWTGCAPAPVAVLAVVLRLEKNLELPARRLFSFSGRVPRRSPRSLSNWLDGVLPHGPWVLLPEPGHVGVALVGAAPY